MNRRAAYVALLVSCGSLGCSSDRATAALMAERAQLRREVAGLRDLRHVSDSGLVRHPDELVLSVADSVLQRMLTASLPVTLVIPGALTVQLTDAQLAFRGNVARVNVAGRVYRAAFPRATADLTVRGTLDEFAVDRTRALHSRIRLDDAVLTSPRDVPSALNDFALGVLQRLVDRSLPQIGSALPDVTLPVRFDHDLRLPGFGPEGALAVEPARADLSISASRVLAYENRLTVVLKVERSPFVADTAPDATRDTIGSPRKQAARP